MMDSNDYLSDIPFDIETSDISATNRRLKVVWTVEIEQEVQASIDEEILADLRMWLPPFERRTNYPADVVDWLHEGF